MASNGKRARIKDIAARAGVAPGTASKALAGSGQLRPETRIRVHRAAAELGFTPLAADDRRDSGFTIGLLSADTFGRFTIPITLGAEDAPGWGEVAMVLCESRGDAVRERHYLRALAARRVDGVLVTGRRLEPRDPVDLPTSVPVVYVFQPCADQAAISVTIDESAGIELAVDHLVGLGRRRIAVITGPQTHLSARARAEAALAAVRDRGAAVSGPVQYGEWSERWGRYAGAAVRRQLPDVDAVLCGSDQIARGVCDGLREHGHHVPRDVAVIGFDNWEVMALASRPPLTTIELDLEQLGRKAATLLLEAIGGRVRPGLHQVTPQLLIRESTVGA